MDWRKKNSKDSRTTQKVAGAFAQKYGDLKFYKELAFFCEKIPLK